MLSKRVFSSPDWASELKRSWQELAKGSETATPFQSWEWHSTWWKHYAKTRRPHVVGLYEGKDLVGIMPLMISRGPWRTVRAMTSGASDYLHPLAAAGYEEQAASALVSHLGELEEVDLIDLHQLRETQPLASAFGASRVIEQATCLVLSLPASFEQYLASLSKSLRFDVRKLDKELFASGKARIEEIDLENLDLGLDVFFETHRKRWRKRGLPGAFVGTRSQRFHREWAEIAQRSGWLWLSVLHHQERPAGAIYAMRFGRACYYYQAGFDPEASAISPGSLLVGHTVRRAIGEGIATFDFLRGDEPYKRRWKPQHEYRNLRLIAPAGGLLGKLGQGWNDLGSRVEQRVRARLEGRSLLR